MNIFKWLSKKVRRVFVINPKVRQINEALGIELYEWQIDYIFQQPDQQIVISLGRATGKTLAHILRIALQPELELGVFGGMLKDITNRRYFSDGRWVYDRNNSSKVGASYSYRQWYKREFMRVYNQLKNHTTLKLCKISKSK